MHHMADPRDDRVPGVGDRPPRKLSRQAARRRDRAARLELFELVQAELRRSGYEGAAVLGHRADRGSAVMRGMAELAEDVFHMPARVGAAVRRRPRRRGLPAALRHRDGPGHGGAVQRRRGLQARDTRNVKQFFGRMWFERNF